MELKYRKLNLFIDFYNKYVKIILNFVLSYKGEKYKMTTEYFFLSLTISIIGSFFGVILALLLNKLIDKKRRDTEKGIWVQNIIHELNSIASSISINTDLSYCYIKNIFMSPDLKYFAKDNYLSLLNKVNNNLQRFQRQVGTGKNNTSFVEKIVKDINDLIERMK